MKKYFENQPRSIRAWMGILSGIAVGALVYLILLHLGPILFDKSPQMFQEATKIPYRENAGVFRYSLIILHISVFLIPAIVYAYFAGKSTWGFLYLKGKPQFAHLLLAAAIAICAIPFINLLTEFNGFVLDSILGEENKLKEIEELTETRLAPLFSDSSLVAIILNLVMIAVMPALSEEFSFRGAIQGTLLKVLKNNPHMAIIFSGVLFSLIHFQFYGFLPRTFFGILFGYMVYWSGSLWPAIFAHFVNNAITVVLMHAVYKGDLPESTESIGATNNFVIAGIISTLVCAVLIRLYYRQYKNDLKREEREANRLVL